MVSENPGRVVRTGSGTGYYRTGHAVPGRAREVRSLRRSECRRGPGRVFLGREPVVASARSSHRVLPPESRVLAADRYLPSEFTEKQGNGTDEVFHGNFFSHPGVKDSNASEPVLFPPGLSAPQSFTS